MSLMSDLGTTIGAEFRKDRLRISDLETNTDILSVNLNNEISRATLAEENLQNSITTLESAVGGDTGTLTDLTTTANGTLVDAINEIDSNLNTEKGRIDSILSASEADKDSFKEIVDLINSVDTENDTAFSGYVLSNNARSTDIEGDITTIQSTLNSGVVSSVNGQTGDVIVDDLEIDAGTVNGKTVETSVPINALFTDTETTTSLTLVGNTLTYTDETGITTQHDLTNYLDDTNLSRLTSGTYNSTTKKIVFSRDDASTFEVDASSFGTSGNFLDLDTTTSQTMKSSLNLNSTNTISLNVHSDEGITVGWTNNGKFYKDTTSGDLRIKLGSKDAITIDNVNGHTHTRSLADDSVFSRIATEADLSSLSTTPDFGDDLTFLDSGFDDKTFTINQGHLIFKNGLNESLLTLWNGSDRQVIVGPDADLIVEGGLRIGGINGYLMPGWSGNVPTGHVLAITDQHAATHTAAWTDISTLVSSGASQLSELSDVDFSTGAVGTGKVLTHNGTDWEAKSVDAYTKVESDFKYASSSGGEITSDLHVDGKLSATTLLVKRFVHIVAIEKDVVIKDSVDVIGDIEIPFDGDVIEVRAKTTTGETTVGFVNNGQIMYQLLATSTGNSYSGVIANSLIAKFSSLTFRTSSASGTGLTLTITIQEV